MKNIRGLPSIAYGIKVFLSLVFSVLICFILMRGEAMSQTIVDEIQLIRKSDRNAVLDITVVVTKFIHIGTAKTEVVNLLKDDLFEIYESNQKNKQGEEILMAIREINLSPVTKFKDEIRIVLGIKNGVVSSVKGKVIYRSLSQVSG